LSEPHRYDFLVIGSGIAGLFYALRVAEHGRVAIVTKKRAADSATNWAQGGIAAVVSSEDSFEDHVRDTLEAGAGLCDERVVRFVVERGPATIDALLKLGVEFDRPPSAESEPVQFELGREGGHSRRRILHRRDATGSEIEHVLPRLQRGEHDRIGASDAAGHRLRGQRGQVVGVVVLHRDHALDRVPVAVQVGERAHDVPHHVGGHDQPYIPITQILRLAAGSTINGAPVPQLTRRNDCNTRSFCTAANKRRRIWCVACICVI